MKEAVIELNTVTLDAGTLETGDNRKVAVLNSLDVANRGLSLPLHTTSTPSKLLNRTPLTTY